MSDAGGAVDDAAGDGLARERTMLAWTRTGLAFAVAGAVLAIVLVGGGDERPRSASSTAGASQAARSTTTAAPAGEAARTEPSPPAPAAASDGDPAELNDQGFTLLKAGDFAGAVTPLRASVEGFRSAGRTDDLNYAYALYNLGTALAGSGDPAGAVDVFQERLKYKDQQGTVKKALRDAQAQLNGGTAKQPKRGAARNSDAGDGDDD